MAGKTVPTNDPPPSWTTSEHRRTDLAKHLATAVCLAPFLWLISAGFVGRLGANPVETITQITGLWALRLLLVSLAITPFSRLTDWRWPILLRRNIALLAYFYAALHLLNYLLFDHAFDWSAVAEDIVKRPFIAAGLGTFLLLTPLAATSSDAMLRLLGKQRWRKLHRLAYVSAATAVMHYFWLVKQDLTGPAAYAIALACILWSRHLPAGLALRCRRRSTGGAEPPATEHRDDTSVR